MKYYLIYISLFFITIFAISCTRYDVEEVLLEKEEISLSWKGTLKMKYDENTWQTAFNRDRNEFRVHDDNMSDWFKVTCRRPVTSKGQEVTADIEWTEQSSIRKRNGLTLTVERMEDDGRIWLWNKSEGLAIVVKML